MRLIRFGGGHGPLPPLPRHATDHDKYLVSPVSNQNQWAAKGADRSRQGRQGQARLWTKIAAGNRGRLGSSWLQPIFRWCNATVFLGPWPRQDVARDSPAFGVITPVPLIYSFKGQFRPLRPFWVSLGQNWVFSDQPGSLRDHYSVRARRGGEGGERLLSLMFRFYPKGPKIMSLPKKKMCPITQGGGGC